MRRSDDQEFHPVDPGYRDRVLGSFRRQRMMAHLGADMTLIEPGSCEITLPYNEALTQQHGYIHGGALATIADSAAGYAAFSLMPANAAPLTVEYKLNILRPGIGETFVARARVVKAGRTLTIVDADVFGVQDGVEKLCLTSLQTLMCLVDRGDGSRIEG